MLHKHTLKTARGELVITHGIAEIDLLISEVRRRIPRSALER